MTSFDHFERRLPQTARIIMFVILTFQSYCDITNTETHSSIWCRCLPLRVQGSVYTQVLTFRSPEFCPQRAFVYLCGSRKKQR